MFSTRLIRRSLPLSINPGLRLCKGQYSGGGLASGACCTASHTRASTAGAVYRLKSTAVEHLVDQLPRRERAPLMGHLVLSGSAANAIADTADDPSMVDGSARAMFPARFPEKDRTRPTVHARAAGGGFRPYTNTSASARRCFTSDSEAKDGDTETSESSPEKTTPSRRKAKASKKVPKAKKEVARNANVTEMPTKGGEGPRDDSGGNALPSGQEEGSKENVTNKARKQATKKVPKDRKEAFRQARNAGVTDRLIKGGGVPRDSRDGDGLPPSGQEEGSTQDLTPSWNEKDYKAGGKGAELPAVTGTITSEDFLSNGVQGEGEGEGLGTGEEEGLGEGLGEGAGEGEGEGLGKSDSTNAAGDEARSILLIVEPRMKSGWPKQRAVVYRHALLVGICTALLWFLQGTRG